MPFNLRTKFDEITLDAFEGSPRASSWIPRHSDIEKIVAYSSLVKKPKMLDAGCDNGFISYLFALEGLDVLGVDLSLREESKVWHNNVPKLRLVKEDIYNGELYKGRNVIFNSWMPQGSDWSGCFQYTKPKPSLIVYVKSQSSGLQLGMPQGVNPTQINTYALPFGFIEVDRWKTFGNDGFILSNNNGIKEKTCEVIVQANKDIWNTKWKEFDLIRNHNPKSSPYNWEKELPKD